MIFVYEFLYLVVLFVVLVFDGIGVRYLFSGCPHSVCTAVEWAWLCFCFFAGWNASKLSPMGFRHRKVMAELQKEIDWNKEWLAMDAEFKAARESV